MDQRSNPSPAICEVCGFGVLDCECYEDLFTLVNARLEKQSQINRDKQPKDDE